MSLTYFLFDFHDQRENKIPLYNTTRLASQRDGGRLLFAHMQTFYVIVWMRVYCLVFTLVQYYNYYNWLVTLRFAAVLFNNKGPFHNHLCADSEFFHIICLRISPARINTDDLGAYYELL